MAKGRTHPTLNRLHARLRRLYAAHDPVAIRFRYGLIAFDAVSILFFMVTAAMPDPGALNWVSLLIGLVILLDLAARLWVAKNPRRLLTRVYTIADILVLASIFVVPLFDHDVGFLRVLRALRLVHSYHLLWDLRRESEFFRRHEDSIVAVINLFVFVVFTSTVVHSFFFDRAGPLTLIDAFYFTVATLTTTGFGDITLDSSAGKLFSIVIMVVGVTLFLQLVRAVFAPVKVRHTCPECGLLRHDIDAIHCKHCGHKLKIATLGVD